MPIARYHATSMSSPSAPPRAARRRALAVLLGVVLALGIGEAVALVASPSYGPRVADYAIAPVSGEPPSWVYVPGSTVTFTWDGDPLEALPEGARQDVPVNALGLRGPLPGPGERSVVVLGDSFTFGEGVAEADTFVGRLDAAWRGRGLRFVNAGVSGHGSVEEAARLEGLLDVLHPVAVLLVHVPNDAVPWDDAADRGVDLLNVASPGGPRLLALLRSLTSSSDVERWYLSFYVGENAEYGEIARSALVWMGEECRRRGVRFGVAAFPLMHRLDAYPLGAITEHAAAAAYAARAPFLDLTPAFAGHDARTLWAHPADRHPNGRAHAIAAEALAPFVEELLQ